MRYLMPMSVGGIAVLAAAVMAGLYYNRALGPVRRREKIAETQ
jgi:hypothetical protein